MGSFKVPGVGTDIRTANRLLKKIGRPVVLSKREQANQITQWCLRNNSPLERYHYRISDDEMKAAMIEASARVDYLLRTGRFFRWAPEAIFDYAFREAIENNCRASFSRREWDELRAKSSENLLGIQANRRANRRFYMLFLVANPFFSTAADWDVRTYFDGTELYEEKQWRNDQPARSGVPACPHAAPG